MNTPFVARERELQDLQSRLDMALAGQGQVCFVIGEAGSGKTTLLTEFVRRALEGHPDLVAAIGQSDAQTGAGDSYLPFREILAELTGDVDPKVAQGALSAESAGRLRRLLRFSGQALAEVGPDLIGIFVPFAGLATRAVAFVAEKAGWMEKLEQMAGRRQPAGGIQQDHIFEQYTNVLRTLAEKHPLLIVLDDLHWTDAGSASLLFRLGRRIGGSRILIVGTYRPAEVELGRGGQRHPLAEVVTEFKRYLGDITVDLAQTRDEGQAFITAFLDAEPNALGEAFRAALFQHTGGHPLFTVELLRYLQERGDLVQDAQGRWTAPLQLHWPQLPARVEGVIEERIGRLAAELRQALTVASVEGEDFTAEVVARVQAVEERDLVRRLSGEVERQHRLVRAEGLLRVGEQRLSRYRFQHNLFQRYLYEELAEGERAYLHEDVGRSLEALYAGHLDEIAVQLARHFDQAGIAGKAVAYLRQAGDQAAARYAHVEALASYGRALELTGDAGERYALLLARERVHSLRGDREAQRRDLEALEATAAGGGGPRAEVLLRQAYLNEATGDLDGSIAAAQEAVHQAQEAGDLPRQAAGYRVWSAALLDQDRFAEAHGYLEQALRISRELGDRRGEGLALTNVGVICDLQGNRSTTLDYYRQALAIFQQVGDRPTECLLLSNLGLACLHAGDPDGAQPYLEQALSLSRQLGFRRGEATVLHNLGLIGSMRGNYLAARQAMEESQRICQEVGDLMRAGVVLESLGVLCTAQGDLPAARSYLEQAMAAARQVGSARDEGHAIGNLGDVYREQGAFAGARSHHEHALQIARQTEDSVSEGIQLANLSVDLAQEGDFAAAEAYSLAALRLARENGSRQGEGSALYALGMVRATLGKPAEARDSYELSLGLARELGDRRAEGIRLAALGQLLGQLGDLPAAREALQRALQIAAEIHDPLTQAAAWAHLGRVLRALDDPGEAATAYQRALALRQELGQPHLALECRAGLACAALAQGDSAQALALARDVQAQLASGPLPGAAETLEAYRDCCRVLEALGDPAAAALLSTAERLRQEQAGRIPIEMPGILTKRLKLILLTTECLRAMLDGDYARASALGGFNVTPDCPLLRHTSIQRRLGMIEKDPEQHPWMYRAIVRSDDNLVVGHISFHHKAPDPDLLEYSSHAAELGYAIVAGQRRKGYARESALAMMEWANRQGVETFCLSISPENIPSLRLAESLGFSKVAERMDETDGLEYVYIRSLTLMSPCDTMGLS